MHTVTKANGNTPSVAQLIIARDSVLTAIYERLKPILNVIKKIRRSDSVYLSEVYEQEGKIVVFVKVARTTGRPENAVITLEDYVFDAGSEEALHTLVGENLATIPHDEE
jgi:hypothetical protein